MDKKPKKKRPNVIRIFKILLNLIKINKMCFIQENKQK